MTWLNAQRTAASAASMAKINTLLNDWCAQSFFDAFRRTARVVDHDCSPAQAYWMYFEIVFNRQPWHDLRHPWHDLLTNLAGQPEICALRERPERASGDPLSDVLFKFLIDPIEKALKIWIRHHNALTWRFDAAELSEDGPEIGETAPHVAYCLVGSGNAPEGKTLWPWASHGWRFPLSEAAKARKRKKGNTEGEDLNEIRGIRTAVFQALLGNSPEDPPTGIAPTATAIHLPQATDSRGDRPRLGGGLDSTEGMAVADPAPESPYRRTGDIRGGLLQWIFTHHPAVRIPLWSETTVAAVSCDGSPPEACQAQDPTCPMCSKPLSSDRHRIVITRRDLLCAAMFVADPRSRRRKLPPPAATLHSYDDFLRDVRVSSRWPTCCVEKPLRQCRHHGRDEHLLLDGNSCTLDPPGSPSRRPTQLVFLVDQMRAESSDPDHAAFETAIEGLADSLSSAANVKLRGLLTAFGVSDVPPSPAQLKQAAGYAARLHYAPDLSLAAWPLWNQLPAQDRWPHYEAFVRDLQSLLGMLRLCVAMIRVADAPRSPEQTLCLKAMGVQLRPAQPGEVMRAAEEFMRHCSDLEDYAEVLHRRLDREPDFALFYECLLDVVDLIEKEIPRAASPPRRAPKGVKK